MLLKDLLKNVTVIGRNVDLNMEVSDVTCNSETVQKGSVFIAVKGICTDGNRFICHAVENGAIAVITDRVIVEKLPYVLVENAQEALSSISDNFWGHPSERMCIIGITGTNGKTSTAMMLKHILEKTTGCCVGLIGTVCNMIGRQELPSKNTTPGCIELQKLLAKMRDAGCRYVVMEVSSHGISQGRIGTIHFQAAGFTNLTEDHLDFHKTMEDYCAAKSKLFLRCDGAVVNGDDPWHKKILGNTLCQVLYISGKGKADLQAVKISLNRTCVRFCLRSDGMQIPVCVPIPGRFSVYNSMLAMGLAKLVGIDPVRSAVALETFSGVKGRLERIFFPKLPFTVMIDYAHTPDGLENILTSVREYCAGRLILLFGCGGDRDREKRPIMGAIATKLADYVIITSDNPRKEDPEAILADILQGVEKGKNNYTVIKNRIKAIEQAIDIGQKNDIIILAGKGHETYQDAGNGQIPFDEREIVRKHLEKTRGRNGKNHITTGGAVVRRQN